MRLDNFTKLFLDLQQKLLSFMALMFHGLFRIPWQLLSITNYHIRLNFCLIWHQKVGQITAIIMVEAT
jgi:hypothetical protein